MQVWSQSIRVGGDELDAAIVNYMKKAYNLTIGERMAEEIKVTVGSATHGGRKNHDQGRDSVAGLQDYPYQLSRNPRGTS